MERAGVAGAGDTGGNCVKDGRGDEWSEGPPRIFLPCSRIGPLGGYGGPAGYTEVAADELPDGPIIVEHTDG